MASLYELRTQKSRHYSLKDNINIAISRLHESEKFLNNSRRYLNDNFLIDNNVSDGQKIQMLVDRINEVDKKLRSLNIYIDNKINRLNRKIADEELKEMLGGSVE